jgi:hypothetical protein
LYCWNDGLRRNVSLWLSSCDGAAAAEQMMEAELIPQLKCAVA